MLRNSTGEYEENKKKKTHMNISDSVCKELVGLYNLGNFLIKNGNFKMQYNKNNLHYGKKNSKRPFSNIGMNELVGLHNLRHFLKIKLRFKMQNINLHNGKKW